jgi:type IV secretory pathway TrbD component
MAEHSGENGHGSVPAVGEQVHLPGPSYLPVVVAFGVTLALVGLVIAPIVAGVGVVITLVAVVRWVREARAEMADLPLEHPLS